MAKLLGGGSRATDWQHCNCNGGGADCLNISVCAATSGRDEFVLAAWNPLGQQVSSWLSIPVSGSGAWQVTTLNASGKPVFVPSQSGALSNRTLSLPELYLNSYHLRDNMIVKYVCRPESCIGWDFCHMLRSRVCVS